MAKNKLTEVLNKYGLDWVNVNYKEDVEKRITRRLEEDKVVIKKREMDEEKALKIARITVFKMFLGVKIGDFKKFTEGLGLTERDVRVMEYFKTNVRLMMPISVGERQYDKDGNIKFLLFGLSEDYITLQEEIEELYEEKKEKIGRLYPEYEVKKLFNEMGALMFVEKESEKELLTIIEKINKTEKAEKIAQDFKETLKNKLS